jgi:ribonuclease BN (tRNA processing enzyme)
VLVTHTHGDHTGGLGTFIHYAFYNLGRHVMVIAPSDEVKADLQYLLTRIEGCDPDAYTLVTPNEVMRPWLIGVIPTRHTPQLEGRCFGYRLLINGKKIIYTGDTATLTSFMPYLTNGVYLYTDVSSYKSGVHLHVDDLVEQVRGLDIHLYLMHFDDFEAIMRAANGSGALPAPLALE